MELQPDAACTLVTGGGCGISSGRAFAPLPRDRATRKATMQTVAESSPQMPRRWPQRRPHGTALRR